jgi:flagellar biosynthesis GTPase FlhF
VNTSSGSLLGKSLFELIADADQLRTQMEMKRQVRMKRMQERDYDDDDNDQDEESEEQLLEQMKNLDEFEKKLVQRRLDEKRAKRVKQEQIERERQKSNAHANNKNEYHLWVDKYAPQSFTQLLSLEKTNREVLKALKRWDTFVFKKNGSNKLSGGGERDSLDGEMMKGSEANEENNGLDTDARPKNKVIMLCGPPGTGKVKFIGCCKSCQYMSNRLSLSSPPLSLSDYSGSHLCEALWLSCR